MSNETITFILQPGATVPMTDWNGEESSVIFRYLIVEYQSRVFEGEELIPAYQHPTQ